MNYSIMRLILADQRRLIALVLVLAVCSLLSWIILLWPVRQLLDIRQASWAGKRRLLQQASSEQLPDQAAVEQRWAALPQRHELPSIIGQFYNYADKSGVTLAALAYKHQPLAQDGVTACTITCGTSGSYASLKRFLSSLTGLPGMSVIERISITAGGPDQQQLTLDVQIVVHLRGGGRP